MAQKKITRLFTQLFLGANIVTIILMIVTGYSYLIDPSKFSIVAIWGMFFPVFLLVNIIFLFFWLFFKPTKAFYPFIALLVCFYPVRMYFGINPVREIPSDAFKVMSYNVLDFRGTPENKLESKGNKLVAFLINEDCDVVCLQEANDNFLSETDKKSLLRQYPYYVSTKRNGNCLAAYSKYPILKTDTIDYESEGNQSAAYTLQTPFGQLLVVNNHLESNHLTNEEKARFESMMSGDMEHDSVRMETKGLYAKLSEAVLKRNSQAKAVARFIEERKDMRIILCGDFNETPVSYNHYVIGKNLTDCFINGGFGFGWSYSRQGMHVRIDNIMCSSHFDALKCQVLTDIHYSDHQPIVSWLQLCVK